MVKKKGSPLDSLQRPELPKLDAVKAAQQHNDTAVQSHNDTTAQSSNRTVEPPTKVPTRSSNVTLPVSMWDWIDDRHREIQRSGWHSARKAAVIRAVLRVAMTVEVDLAGVMSEEEIVQRYKRAMKQPHN
ncbi:MAG: hypothetical protein AAF702_05220 [Chloroflexota bacterium]